MEKKKVVFIRKNGRVIPVKINDKFEEKKATGARKLSQASAVATGLGLAQILMASKDRSLIKGFSLIGAGVAGGIASTISRKKTYEGDTTGFVNSQVSANKSSNNIALGALTAGLSAPILHLAGKKSGFFRKAGEKAGSVFNKVDDSLFNLKNKISPLKKKTDLSKFDGKTFKTSSKEVKKISALLGYNK
jgi:hypothetical protein